MHSEYYGRLRRVISVLLSLMLVVSFINVDNICAAKKYKLSKTNVTLIEGNKVTLKLKGAKAFKVKWSVSDKKIASVSKKGVVTAKKVGKAKVTAKYLKKKYVCKVVVNSKAVNAKTTTEPADISTTEMKDTTETVTTTEQSTTEPDAVVSSKWPSVTFVNSTVFDSKVNEVNKCVDDILSSNTVIRKDTTFVQGETYTGTAYYLAANGDDNNDGLSELTPWKTFDRLNKARLEEGDAVFFHRGDTFRGCTECASGVTYASYGTGNKPIITGSPENGADPEKWTLVGNSSDGGKIWKYYKDMTDCGNLYFDDNPVVDHKVTPNRNNSGFVDGSGNKFDVFAGLKKDLSFISFADSKLPSEMSGFVDVGGSIKGSVGELYLRCDKGNPGEIFSKIEFGTSNDGSSSLFGIGHNVSNVSIIDLDMRIVSSAAIQGVGSSRYLIKNCVMAYCGGYVLNYKNGVPERCGGGICASGSDFVIDGCYIHDNWDEGITIECGYNGVNTKIEDIRVSNNVINRHACSGLQFIAFEQTETDHVVFKNIELCNNYFYEDADNWGHDVRGGDYGNGALSGESLKVGDFQEPLVSENLSIHDNVFYNSTGSPLNGCLYGSPYEIFKNNTFLLVNEDSAVAIFRLEGFDCDWYRFSNRDLDGDVLYNQIIGKDNKFIIKK